MTIVSAAFTRAVLAAAFCGIAAGSLSDADAATVQISFSGSTDGAAGLSYPAGGTFNGRVVYETDGVADASAAPNFGTFDVAPTLIELATPLGALSYAPSPSHQPANISTFTQQENLAGQQTSRLSFGSNEFGYDGFTGALSGYKPISFDLVLQTIASPVGDMLFADPNVLLSGANALISALLINSVVQVVFTNDAMNNYGTTTLVIDAVSFSALGGGAPDPSEVPVPGAGLLLLTGVLGAAALKKPRSRRLSVWARSRNAA